MMRAVYAANDYNLIYYVVKCHVTQILAACVSLSISQGMIVNVSNWENCLYPLAHLLIPVQGDSVCWSHRGLWIICFSKRHKRRWLLKLIKLMYNNSYWHESSSCRCCERLNRTILTPALYWRWVWPVSDREGLAVHPFENLDVEYLKWCSKNDGYILFFTKSTQKLNNSLTAPGLLATADGRTWGL